jgi:hypothetical protein
MQAEDSSCGGLGGPGEKSVRKESFISFMQSGEKKGTNHSKIILEAK